jgi:hypothetical protein
MPPAACRGTPRHRTFPRKANSRAPNCEAWTETLIIFVITKDHRYTLEQIIPDVIGRRTARIMSYDQLFRQTRITAGCLVFTDHDRLRHHELVHAAALARRCSAAGIRVLNDPARVRQRYDLLFHLHREGMNRFRAYPAVERPRPQRFPVFLKCETDHRQDFDVLIPDQASLDRTLDAVCDQGTPLRDLLVIEFANVPRREGVYQRRTMFRIGGELIAGNPINEDKPFVKYGTAGLTRDDEFDELADFMKRNPDAAAIARAFDLANIEFGRADYGFDGDGLAIYEINTNPQIGRKLSTKHARFTEALAASFDAVTAAMRKLDAPDHTVRLMKVRHYRSRLTFDCGFRLKQP